MEFELLDKKSWSNSQTNKYFIKNWIESKSHIIKVGRSLIIEKEYEIAKLLKSITHTHFRAINSFIRYIYYFLSNDELKKNHIHNNLNKVLVMPYYMKGSIGKYNWNIDNFHLLKSLLKEIFIALNTAYDLIGFIHNDTHLDNFLISDENKVVIMDFENSLIDETRNNYRILYFGFSQILIELKIKAKLDIYNIKDIIEYVNIHEKLNKQLDIQNLLLLVDSLKFENKIVFQM
jgi:serine/threonine protein kinase